MCNNYFFLFPNRNYDPPIWYDTFIKLFHVHKQDGNDTAEPNQN